MIPLGLYRTVKVNLKAYKDQQQLSFKSKNSEGDGVNELHQENTIKKIQYVVTNPDKDTRIEEEDLVFVLAKSEPGDPDTWDDMNNLHSKEDFGGPKPDLLQDFDPLMSIAEKGLKKKKK